MGYFPTTSTSNNTANNPDPKPNVIESASSCNANDIKNPNYNTNATPETHESRHIPHNNNNYRKTSFQINANTNRNPM